MTFRRGDLDGVSLLLEDKGSIMVEVAIALPVLILLLFAGLDITRYVQMIHRVDQATVTVADALAKTGELTNKEMPEILNVASDIISNGHATPHLKVIVRNLVFDPVSMGKVIWAGEAGNVPVPCSAMPSYDMPGMKASFPNQYLVKVQICSVPGDRFYLSGLIPFADLSYSSVTTRHIQGNIRELGS